MASRADERRTNFIVGMFVLAMTGLLVGSLFVIAVSEGWGVRTTELVADFHTVSGLARNSKVQLAGKEIGKVQSIQFISPIYACSPESEDLGRVGARTNECEGSLFCAEEPNGGGVCAELERYTGSDNDYKDACTGMDCPSGTVCVNKSFSSRYARVRWYGPEGVCVPYSTELRRVRVAMEVEADKLLHIANDSRATIQSNGVLGDQLVNVTVGHQAPVEPGGRVLTAPSIMEDLNRFKERLDGITDKVDKGLAGFASVFGALNNEGTKRDLREIIGNVSSISGQVKDGSGLVGAMFSDPRYKEDVALTLKSIRLSATQLEETVSTLNREIEPAVRGISGAASSVEELAAAINDPSSRSVIALAIHDDEMGEDLKKAIAEGAEALGATKETVTDVQVLVAEVQHAVTSGEGTLGKLIKDPKAYDDLVKLIGNAERNNVIKKLVRFVVAQDEFSESAGGDDVSRRSNR